MFMLLTGSQQPLKMEHVLLTLKTSKRDFKNKLRYRVVSTLTVAFSRGCKLQMCFVPTCHLIAAVQSILPQLHLKLASSFVQEAADGCGLQLLLWIFCQLISAHLQVPNINYRNTRMRSKYWVIAGVYMYQYRRFMHHITHCNSSYHDNIFSDNVYNISKFMQITKNHSFSCFETALLAFFF